MEPGAKSEGIATSEKVKFESIDFDWMFEFLGWCKSGRRQSNS